MPPTRRRVPGDLLVHLRDARDHLDRHYAEDVSLADAAAVAGLSKYHFLRSFALVYGTTPAAYLSERRIERAQDLLRATNLTVTEVCHAVGYSSLGSFSSRFVEIVGETPSAFQRRYAVAGAPRIPGCWVFMAGLVERRSAIEEKPSGADYLIEAMQRAQAEGGMPGVGLNVDDCRATVDELRARGVEFLQEPQERPYGVEALMRDNSGNWVVLVEPRAYTPEDFEGVEMS